MADLTRSEQVKRTVIAGLIVAGVAGLVGVYWADVVAGVKAAFTWLGEPVSISRWWYGLLLIVAGGLVLLIGAAIFANRQPEYGEYVEDEFFGFVWRWKWNAHGQVLDLQWFCPICDRIGVYDHNRFDQITTFFCSECRRPQERPGSRDQMLNAVMREINLKVRNGQWKEVVEVRKATV